MLNRRLQLSAAVYRLPPLTVQLTLSAHLYNVFYKKYQAVATSAYHGEARNLRVSLAMKF